jgi:hypothetical protein
MRNPWFGGLGVVTRRTAASTSATLVELYHKLHGEVAVRKATRQRRRRRAVALPA